MTHFTPLTREERKLRDSIVLDRLKKELESFVIPKEYITRIQEIREEFAPYLHSENKLENAIAVDCNHKLGEILFIFNILSDENK